MGSSLAAADIPLELRECAALENDGERLSCYDRFLIRSATPEPGQESVEVPLTKAEALASVAPVQDDDEDYSILGRHWELDPDQKRGVFNFRPHRKNYLAVTYNSSPNEEPYRPLSFLAPEADGLSNTELSFQLGFKLKALENIAGTPMDLWFGYTQHSYWQATNSDASSPFRESNYQPELMAVYPMNVHLPAGLRLRFLNAGLVHQSNGQGGELSRSWNRVYLQAGLEGKNITLLPRIWHRIGESASEDDNPDIIDYAGHGDLLTTYYRSGHEISLLARYNFSTGKGSGHLGWAFPLTSNLKGLVQYFSGYGYSLIDYNAYQRVFSLGFQVNF